MEPTCRIPLRPIPIAASYSSSCASYSSSFLTLKCWLEVDLALLPAVPALLPAPNPWLFPWLIPLLLDVHNSKARDRVVDAAAHETMTMRMVLLLLLMSQMKQWEKKEQ